MIFSKCCKRKELEEKYEETKTNYEGIYLSGSWADSAHI